MSNKDFERVIREDTRIALQKINEMKSSWGDLFSAGPQIASKAISKYSRYAKSAVADSSSNDSERFKDIPREIKREPGSPEAKSAADQLAKDKAKPNVGLPTSDLPDTRDPRGDAAPNMAKAKEVAAKTGMTRNNSDGTAAPGGAKTEPEPVKLPKIDVPGEKSGAGTSKTAMSFKQAFAAARKEAKGGKGQFEYKGTKYQTNIQGTGTKEKPQEKFISAGKQKVTSVKVGSDAPKAPEAPKTPEAPKAPEAAKPAPETPKTTSQTTPQTPPSSTTSDTKSEPTVNTKVQYAPSGTEGPSSSGGTGGAGGEGGSGSNAGKGGDGGAGSEGGKGGKGGKGGNTLGECVVIAGNKYRIV